MKILLIFPHFLTPGGAAKTALKYAKELQLRGNSVEILCAKVSKEFIKENPELNFRELNIPISSSASFWAFFPYWQYKINRILRKYPDYIFYPHVLPSNWWAWLYKLRNQHTKIVWHCHEPSAFIHSKAWIDAIPNPIMKIGAKLLNPILKALDIKLEKENNSVYCNSMFVMEEYKRVYKKKADHLIYPPIIILQTQPERDKSKHILTVSRLSKFKRVDLLIDAFSMVTEKHPEYQLIITGEGEETENLVKQTKSLGLEDKIEFRGKVNNEMLENLYKNSRVTVLCSENEPFGLVPVESMMNGTPVIAHNSGGPKETIIHTETGFLYEDKNDLIKYLALIISMDEKQYQKMQNQCIHHVKKYDLAKTISNLEEAFSNIS